MTINVSTSIMDGHLTYEHSNFRPDHPGKEKNVGGKVESFFLLLLLSRPSPAPIRLGDKIILKPNLEYTLI